MPKYRTLDQHIQCNHELIEPGTVVEVSEEDVPTWETLVSLKVAERLTPLEELEAIDESDEGVEVEGDAQPVPPGTEA